MRSLHSLLMLVFSLPFCHAQTTNTAPATTNLIAFYLVESKIPWDDSVKGTIAVTELKLSPIPILADNDFVSWNVKQHSFVIKPEAVKRLGAKCWQRIVPFVLVCEGERIYAGQFGTSFSSTSAAIPTILCDSLLYDLFANHRKLPDTFWRELMLATEATLQKATYKTQNVTLQIDAGYPPPDGFGGKDLRGDKRVQAAVEKWMKRKTHPVTPAN